MDLTRITARRDPEDHRPEEGPGEAAVRGVRVAGQGGHTHTTSILRGEEGDLNINPLMLTNSTG